jgi:hypothetical protein
LVEEWLKPAAAAHCLQMPASTLRVYSTRFGSLLSSSASDPPIGSDGKRGSRLYSSTDVAILTRAKDMLATGMTYEQVLSELRLSLPGARSRGSTNNSGDGKQLPLANGQQSGSGESIISTTQVEILVMGLINASVANSERMIKAWQDLAEERAKEIIMLRARIRELEDGRKASDGRKPGGLGRIFG